MDVVPAGVHFALVYRGVWPLHGLVLGNGVDVGPQGYGRARPARKARHRARFGAYGQNLNAGQALQRFQNFLCGARLFKAELGVAVQVRRNGAQPRAEVLFAKRRCNRQESSLLFSGMRRRGCGSPVQTVTIVRALRPFCKALQAEKRQIPAEFLDKKRPVYL